MKAKGVKGKRYTAINAPSAEILAAKPGNSFDSLVTDPPAWVEFMGKSWDKADLDGFRAVMQEAYRVLKPGAHGLVWALPRTSYLTAYILAEVGFEVRDMITHLFGTGFPKSLNIGKLVEGYEGWGTGLKPASEVWWLIRKPVDRGLTVAENVARWGTGAINIGASRVPGSDSTVRSAGTTTAVATVAIPSYGSYGSDNGEARLNGSTEGRWPANLVLSHSPGCTEECDPTCPIAELDRQSGISTVVANAKDDNRKQRSGYVPEGPPLKYTGNRGPENSYTDTGGASRFFNTFEADIDRLITFIYKAKPGRKERDRGCEHLPPKTAGQATDRQDGSDGLNSPRAGAGRTGGARNHHPTVKAVGLMEWLITMITPTGGTILDPYAGSGSTGVAALGIPDRDYKVYCIERDTTEGYFAILAARLAAADNE